MAVRDERPDRDGRAGGIVRAIHVAFPVLLLATMAIAWVRYGADLPLLDDWRDFMEGTAGSLAPADLFRPANDTLYATGKFLDALAVRFLAYNGVVYQLLTMILCLGGLLLLYYRLLFRSLPPMAAAFGFLTTIFMLQPYSYWGLQNLAYHQILPPLFLLISFKLIDTPRVSNGVLASATATLAALGGFAYISGAFLAASAAVVAFLVSTRGTDDVAQRLRWFAAGLAIAALVTVPAQLWVILVVQDGQTHSAQIPWTMPWTIEFWVFLFGLVGRTVRAQTMLGPYALCLTAALVGALLLTTLAEVVRVVRRRQSWDELRVPAVYLTLVAGVGLYAVMVSAGRASHGASPDLPLYDWFRRSGDRFHYFWITLLLPFVGASLIASIRTLARPLVTGLLASMVVAYAAWVGTMAHATNFEAWTKERVADARCIQERVLAELPVFCGTIVPMDLTMAVSLARDLDMSFARSLLTPATVTVEGGAFRDETSLGAPAGVRVEGARAQEAGEAILLAEAGADPQLLLDFPEGARGAFGACRVLRVKGTVSAEHADVVQFFAATPNSPDYGEALSDFARYDGGGPQAFDLTVGTPRDGFLPAIRLDPGRVNDAFRIENLSASCR